MLRRITRDARLVPRFHGLTEVVDDRFGLIRIRHVGKPSRARVDLNEAVLSGAPGPHGIAESWCRQNVSAGRKCCSHWRRQHAMHANPLQHDFC